ncbi:MAG TPA: PAS domain S-box protein [Prolixibacteraceae bacterium]|nr:PAS domain S-box protein [Prolixibacteraceae bacterium]
MNSERETYRVIILEDNPNDKDLIEFELSTSVKAHLVFEWVIDKQHFMNALIDFHPDIILSDYNLPQFNGFEALALTTAHDKDLPFIIVTGTLTEEVAAESIKLGAWEYVVKERLNRLPSAFENALKLKAERLESRKIKAELKLRKEKNSIQLKLLWDAISNAPNAVEITTNDGTIQYINSRFEEMTGYTSSEVVGKKTSILKSGAHDQSFYKKLWDTILTGKEWKGELINKKKNGELYWEEVSISPVADHVGIIQYFVAFKSDISERKKAEEELRESRQIFQTLAQSSPVGIFRTNAEGDTTYVNPKWSELSGLSFDEAMGSGWKNAVHPDDRTAMFGSWEKHKTRNTEYRFLKPDGSVVWVIGNVLPELKEDQIEGYIGTITNITDRKQFEEQLQESKTRYQNLVEDINDILYEVDDSLCFSYISPVITKKTGYPIEYYLGKHLSEIINPEDMERVLSKAEHLLKEADCTPVEYRIDTINGDIIWVQSSSKPIMADEKAIGIRGIAIDITLQKEAEKELIEAKERAEASDRLKTDFMNNISHEIRTPLNGILGFAPMVFNPDISEQEKLCFLDIMNESGERLIQTINNYMDISLITSGNMEVRKQLIFPIHVIEKLCLKYELILKKKDIILQTEIQTDISTIQMNTDTEMLTKVFEHLLRNASVFAKNGIVTLGASIEDQHIRFYIRDTGPGITPEAQQIIFERFMQEEASSTRKNEGSGLGLSIVKGLVELLGGTVWLKSEKGKGSTFNFTISLD